MKKALAIFLYMLFVLACSETNVSPTSSYTATFNSKGGSAVVSQTVVSGGKLTQPASVTYIGYTLEGWYTDEAYTSKFDFTTATVTSNITLYAKWLSVNVTTLAGDGTRGYQDGTGAATKFNQPSSVAVDGSGNVYVADQKNHRIRKITSTGVVSTLAGDGTAGYLDGTGTAAKFSDPASVAVDGSGNVYVADQKNHRIRKITSTGVVSTLAGDGTAGYQDGAGTAAKFDIPSGVAVDGSGNVYVADASNNMIRKITSAGVVTTFAGDITPSKGGYLNGIGTAAKFNFPTTVAVDGSGNVYVADMLNNRIRKITSAGVVSTFAGDGTQGYIEGTGTLAKLNWPTGVTVDGSGNVYVADLLNQRIRKITSAGVVTTFAGDGTAGYLEGTRTAAKFNGPSGVAVDGSGNVYVADALNHRIRKISQ